MGDRYPINKSKIIMGTLKLFNIGDMVTFSHKENSMISLKNMEILISNGKIIEIGSKVSDADQLFDCEDKLVTPGFVDCHTHPVFVDDRENEFEMRKDMKQQAQEMMESAGFKGVYSYDGIDTYNFGHGIHEMGTARMGKDPKTSVLNGNNQIHSVKNVYVTDGSCMTSAGNQNPSITYMALTARAVNHAVEELKKMNI